MLEIYKNFLSTLIWSVIDYIKKNNNKKDYWKAIKEPPLYLCDMAVLQTDFD